DVLGRKAAARGHVAALLREHHGRAVRQELVGRRTADAVLLIGIGDFPVASGPPVGLANRVALARENPRRGVEYVAVRIVRSPRPRPKLVLGDGIALTV